MRAYWPALLLAIAWTRLLAESVPDRLTVIRSEREQLTSTLEQQEAVCQHRFAVTDCVNAVRKRRREVLLPLQREENQLLLQERQDRDQMRAQKKSETQESSTLPPLQGKSLDAGPLARATSLADRIKNHHAQASARAAASKQVAPKPLLDTQTEASNREAFAAKSATAQKRLKERETRIKSLTDRVAPLPVPP